MSQRVGRVTSGDGQVVAELYDDGSWRVLRDGHADPAAGRDLAERHIIVPPTEALDAAAAELAGTVEMGEDD